MEELLKYAEKRRDDSAEYNEGVHVTQYWVGYIDGLKAAMKKCEAVERELAELKADNAKRNHWRAKC